MQALSSGPAGLQADLSPQCPPPHTCTGCPPTSCRTTHGARLRMVGHSVAKDANEFNTQSGDWYKCVYICERYSRELQVVVGSWVPHDEL